MELDNVLGKKIKIFRDKRNWKQETLAEKAGLTQSEISKIENGNVRAVREDTILRLAQALEIQPEILTRGTPFAHLFNSDPMPYESVENQRTPVVAYFASALTGLTAEQESEIKELDQAVNDICRNYQTYPVALYRPRLSTSPTDNPDVSAKDVYIIDRERVASSDLVFLATLYPSLGAGMELQIALQSCSTVIFLKRQDQGKISRMVLGCPVRHKVIEYADLKDLHDKVNIALNEMLPSVTEHRLSEAETVNNLALGSRIQELRELRKLSQSELAERIGVDVTYIEGLEEISDRIINPSLEIIRRISTVLWTSAAYLISGLQGMDERFREHHAEFKSLALETDLTLREFDDLWLEHFETYKSDLNFATAKNRADVGNKAYWKGKMADRRKGNGKLF